MGTHLASHHVIVQHAEHVAPRSSRGRFSVALQDLQARRSRAEPLEQPPCCAAPRRHPCCCCHVHAAPPTTTRLAAYHADAARPACWSHPGSHAACRQRLQACQSRAASQTTRTVRRLGPPGTRLGACCLRVSKQPRQGLKLGPRVGRCWDAGSHPLLSAARDRCGQQDRAGLSGCQGPAGSQTTLPCPVLWCRPS